MQSGHLLSVTSQPSRHPAINTAETAKKYRAKILDGAARSVLISRLAASEQAGDLTVPANCSGFGRIRHFRRGGDGLWPANPLPLDPAAKALGLPRTDALEAQVFQNAACAWRCWYCFVPYNLLSGDERRAKWMTADEMVDLLLAEVDHPRVIDLTGGSPDLTPEWVAWFMDALMKRRLENHYYLWSDDNLSTDFYWEMNEEERELIEHYPMYGRVACFKGFDAQSFSFNTGADADQFDRQLARFSKLAKSGIDLYAYVTVTSPAQPALDERVDAFIDRLRTIHHNLPLRTVPLRIQEFSPVASRLDAARIEALHEQDHAIAAWNNGLLKRYTTTELEMPITEVCLE